MTAPDAGETKQVRSDFDRLSQKGPVTDSKNKS